MRRHQDPTADRISSAPQCAGGALTDNRDPGRRQVVLIVEETTTFELDPHCREVAGRRDLVAQRGIEAGTLLSVWLSFENDRALRANGSKGQWTQIHGAGTFDIREC